MERFYHCPGCGRSLSFDDKICPFCGTDLTKHMKKRKGEKFVKTMLLTALILLAATALLGKPVEQWLGRREFESEKQQMREDLKELTPPFPFYEEELNQAAGEDCSTLWDLGVDAQLACEHSLPEEDRRILQKALIVTQTWDGLSEEGYLKAMRQKGFREEEARLVLPCLRLNWNHEALRSALFTFGYRGISRGHMEKILDHQGFTPEQIRYAMDHVHPDYSQQAVLSLYFHLKTGPLSPREARWRLEDDLYTQSEVQWALENCGVDWKEIAWQTGHDLLGYERRYQDDVVQQLINQGYNEEQVRYAAQKLQIPITPQQETKWKGQEKEKQHE